MDDFSDQFAFKDPAAAVIHSTGHQMVSVCRAVCAEEQSLLLDPVMSSEYLIFVSSFSFCLSFPQFVFSC